MKFTGRASRTIRSNAAASPQGERSNGHRPHLSDRSDKPRPHILWRLAPHVHMLKYIYTVGLSTFFFASSGIVPKLVSLKVRQGQLNHRIVVGPYGVEIHVVRPPINFRSWVGVQTSPCPMPHVKYADGACGGGCPLAPNSTPCMGGCVFRTARPVLPVRALRILP